MRASVLLMDRVILNLWPGPSQVCLQVGGMQSCAAVQNLMGAQMLKRLGLGLVLALIALPAFGQNKEQDRVANANKVMQEIVNVPDDIPQSVVDTTEAIPLSVISIQGTNGSQ